MGKWLIRLAVFPAVVLLTILEWIGTYILDLSEMLCKLIGGMFFILTVVAYLIGLASVEQAANTLLAGFILYLVPQVGKIIFTCMAFLHIALMEVIKK